MRIALLCCRGRSPPFAGDCIVNVSEVLGKGAVRAAYPLVMAKLTQPSKVELTVELKLAP